MVLKNCCCCTLETGGLVLGILGSITSLIFFIFGIFELNTDMHDTKHNMLLATFLDEAPDHIVRVVYVAISIVDILSSVLLVVGIVKRIRYLLMPWIVNTITILVLSCLEIAMFLIPSVILTATIGGILYIWYSMISLYIQFQKEEEDSNTGVQMAYVEESSGPLPPYSILNVDK